MNDKVVVKCYDGSLVSIPIDKKDEYLHRQEEIKNLLAQGKTKEEVLRIIDERENNWV